MNDTYKKSYNLINANLQVLIKSDINALFLLSKAGLGKTTLTLKTMQKSGYQEGGHYAYYNSYFTPLAFFKALNEVNKLKAPKIMVLDDVEMILKDKNILNLMKASTWQNEKNKRTITYETTSTLIPETEKKIDFGGKMIILLNEIPDKNPSLSAMIDRSLFLELKFTNKEIFDLMESEILKKDYAGLKPNQRYKVFNFIKTNATKESDISFRTLIKGFNNFLYAPNSWQEMVLESLKPQN